MDKYEYKVRADEIKELIAEGDYVQAAEIADTIDWRRVKSVMMLCIISDLYKINRRYEDAKNMLLLAYERKPGGKTICYSLCELCIKTEEFVQAVNYYKEFVQVAPKDSGRYILQYKLYEAQDVSLEERIGVLEELKKRDYREKWAYELAYLYHRVGLATRCVEECDELILWFGEGKYVIKAMELKMLHQPLSTKQQEKYEHRFDGYRPAENAETDSEENKEYSEPPEQEQSQWGAQPQEQAVQEPTAPAPQAQENVVAEAEPQPEEMDIQVKTMDVGQYNTINLQAELAAGLREVLAENREKSDAITRSIVAPMMDSDTEALDFPEIDEVDESDLGPEAEVMEESEVFFGETADLSGLQQENCVPEGMEEIEAPAETDETAEAVMNQMRAESEVGAEQLLNTQPPKELAGVLSQESDGQISLIVPENAAIEKQITGQMSIEDILVEWERMKRENEERRKEEVRQHVLEQTGTMFTEFEAAVRDGLLEQLESGQTAESEEILTEAEPEEVPTEEPQAEETEEELSTEEAEEVLTEEPEEEPFTEESEEETAASEEEFATEEAQFEEEILEEQDAAEDYGEVEEIEEIQEPDTEEEEAAEGAAEEVLTEAEPEEELLTEEPLAEEAEEELSIEDAEEKSSKEEVVSEEEAFEEESEAVQESEAEASTEATPVEREKAKVRALTREEKELFAPFIQSRSGREKLVKAIDNVSMAAYTGNIIITGEEGMDTLTLAKNMIREVQMADSNFSGKVAKISGNGMNSKNVAETLSHLKSGALIIQKASEMNEDTAKALYKALQKESIGIIVVLEDSRKAMNKLLAAHPQLQESFTARMDVEAMSNDTLVAFGRQYARELEYSIDEFGVLALHTRIEEMQTIDHVVTVVEVKEIVDEAIRHANRKTLGHFIDILLAKRYDDEDMIILTEKDFV